MFAQNDIPYFGDFVELTMTFSERLTILMKDRKVTAKELSEKLEIGKNQFKYWADKGNTPSGETVSKLADYFEVPVDYLIGKTDDPSPQQKKPAAISDELWEAMQNNPRAVALLELLLKMSPEQMDAIEKVIGREEK